MKIRNIFNVNTWYLSPELKLYLKEKTETFIHLKKRQNQRYKNAISLNKQPWDIFQNQLIYNKTQRLNCVVDYLNVKNYTYLIEMFD